MALFQSLVSAGSSISPNTADLAVLRDLVDAGAVRPAVDRTYRLSEAAAAVSHVQDGRARGKVVVAA